MNPGVCDLPTQPGSVIEAKPPGRKKAFLMALTVDGWWQRLDGPFEERGPFRDVVVLFDAATDIREAIAQQIEAEANGGRWSGHWTNGLLQAAGMVRGPR